ncbi:MAG: DUF1223 domain-containing protein [Lysobacterales bacterium]
MLKIPMAASLALLSAQPIHAAEMATCERSSGSNQVTLVELYTSEGCSSCPPADRWLARLPSDETLIALAFHVDYWDWIGWPDRFAQADFSRRQRAQVSQRGARSVYTPQVFSAGRELVRWYDQPQPPKAAVPAAELSLQASFTSGGAVAYQWDWQGDTDDGVMQLAVVQSQASTDVRAGENAGRALQHAHVVRALQANSLRTRDRGELQLPADLPMSDAALVAWVEDRRNGAVRQAVRLPLSCLTDQSTAGGSL